MRRWPERRAGTASAASPATRRTCALIACPTPASFAGGCVRSSAWVAASRVPSFTAPAHRADAAIALTFDDGPSPYTKRVLGILDRAGAKGTFFVVGSEVPGDTSELRRALAHGHELGNHSLNHELHPSSASLRATSDRIRAATGFTPCTFRPPYGDYNSGTVAAAQANGMSTVIWDVDPKDWSLPGSSTIYSRVVAGAHPGAIIIMHDGGGPRGQTVAALPRIIAELESRGYDLVTVTELLGERFRWAAAG